tara:strand:+ start:7192 stop:7713 length:522 start_codon:yes stop_codon:yes gene_type:complete
VNKLAIFLLFIFSVQVHAQRYIGQNGKIIFFSEALVEDISAVNSKVSAVFDSRTGDLVFQLNIIDFIFPKALMQEHFNENYLESDIYPTSIFSGKVVASKNDSATVQGDLTIHGKTNKIKVIGSMIHNKESIFISAAFSVMLEDYDIRIPKIVMYKIAEEIDVTVNIELEKIE